MTGDVRKCPVCSTSSITPMSEELLICAQCGIAFNTAYALKTYNDTYFLDEYRNQYGKTYIDDRHNICNQSKKRLLRILKLISGRDVSSTDLSLLDIGSAAGFFLQCARDMGIRDVSGIEISEYAARYCEKQFNIPVTRSSFDDVTLTSPYSIITAWYFIEHCGDPLSVMRKIYNALDTGGIFAFSVPSIFGPLYTFNRVAWIETHPSDHFIDFSPRGVKKILTGIGFTKISIRPAGIHPERVINPRSFFYRPFVTLYNIYSQATSFSDTIEVYAIK
ncbi:MAG: class I SAM-dependent methyltransferase [Spirochaetes bacterium]|nr:class I SAM-dependent methyltransferase [Spirochaetota bacterium]